ncbi:hypothetical protein [Streptomyces canus]|uniref:hypothetical protein n=1 Tax=Streptomyces canus TaxID=58343 RepID=UPI003CF45553
MPRKAETRAAAAHAAPASHVAPDQVTADLANHSPAEVWQRHVHRDNSGRLAQHKPRGKLDNVTLTCRIVTPSDDVSPTALAEPGPHCPLGLWGPRRQPAARARGARVLRSGE